MAAIGMDTHINGKQGNLNGKEQWAVIKSISLLICQIRSRQSVPLVRPVGLPKVDMKLSSM